MTNDELVEAVARLVTPWAFDLTPAHYRLEGPEQFKLTRAYAAQELAKDTARAAISTIYEALQEPSEDMVYAAREAMRKTRTSGVCGQTIEACFANEYARELACYHAMLTASPLNGGKE